MHGRTVPPFAVSRSPDTTRPDPTAVVRRDSVGTATDGRGERPSEYRDSFRSPEQTLRSVRPALTSLFGMPNTAAVPLLLSGR